MKNIMVIINPKAGSETGDLLIDVIEKHLQNYFDEILIKTTKTAEDSTLFGKEAADKKFDSVMIVGGDGTINGVIKGFVNYEYRPKIAIVPAGTGNILAKILGVPIIRKRAIHSYHFNKTKKMNLGVCNNDVFNMFASLGPVPEAIHDVSSEQKTALGFLAYVFNAMSKLANSEISHITVKSKEHYFEGPADHLFISLVNGIGLLKFSELDESVAQGKANIFIQRSKKFIDRMQTVTSAIGGKLEGSEGLDAFSSNEIVIDALEDQDLYIDLDGEKGPALPVKIKILIDYIDFYLPENNIIQDTHLVNHNTLLE